MERWLKLLLHISIKQDSPTLTSIDSQRSYSERPYQYGLSCNTKGQEDQEDHLTAYAYRQLEDETECSGSFGLSGLFMTQQFRKEGNGISETLSLSNPHTYPVRVNKVHFGFLALLRDKTAWQLRAIPFLVQLDGSVHDYTMDQLVSGTAKNARYVDASREEPPIREDGLRSEAWAWGDDTGGIVIIKYNNEQVEYSIAAVDRDQGDAVLRFGGAGLAFYGEPLYQCQLNAGETFTFGKTYYFPYEGTIQAAYALYRLFIEQKGHTFPKAYNPPVNWNVLYDIGWHHSDADQLHKHYHKEAILLEAEKARDCGCELLYLDPGWEVAEGLTLWDESRLGSVSDLATQLKVDFGLDLGYRTILRTYKKHWDEAYQVQHSYGLMQPERMKPVWGYHFWEPCLCHPEFFEEKLKRILEISKQGMKFMMFDEMDWRGPCYDPSHGHTVPSTARDHIEAVYRLAAEVRKQCPDILTEVHDPVSPWSHTLYAPTYFRQGPAEVGSYDEHWGFEYMWNCIDDLKTGKALALYYYNLGSSIPLYLHITMAADNDACIFFWWTASTVRHLGIGGKTSHPTVEFAGALAPFDREQRFRSYREQMNLYRKLKPFFARGTFHGIAEHIHLHTLAGQTGGVINVFNLTEDDQEFVFSVPTGLFGSQQALAITGAIAIWENSEVEFRLRLGALSPGIIRVGVETHLVE
jgi:hypothetical protein